MVGKRDCVFILSLGLALGIGTVLRAADWNWCLAAITITAAAFFLSSPYKKDLSPDPTTLVLFAIIGVIALLQIVPLPVGLVAHLSPARAELARAAATLLGRPLEWVPLSEAPFATIQMIVTLGGYGLLFLMLRDLGTRSGSNWILVWPLFAIAAFEGVLGLLQTSSGGADSFARGTYENRDHYAGLLEMILPLALMYGVAILRRGPQRHFSLLGPALKSSLVLALAALILIAIVRSLSRMGFLAALASLLVTGFLAIVVHSPADYGQERAPLWRRIAPITAVALLVGLGFVFLPTDALIARFGDFATSEGVSSDQRHQIWAETVGLIKAFPLFGCGLGTYESCFMRFKAVAPMQSVQFAHNDYLQILAELGIVAFAAGAVLAGRLIFMALRRTVYARSIDERFLMIGCIGSLLAILLHSFVDFNLYIQENGAVFAWICGITASGLPYPGRHHGLGPQTITVDELV